MSRLFVPTTSLSRDSDNTLTFEQLPDEMKVDYFHTEPPFIDQSGLVSNYYDAMCVEAAIFLGITHIWVQTNWC
jgi:hypothetical protein